MRLKIIYLGLFVLLMGVLLIWLWNAWLQSEQDALDETKRQLTEMGLALRLDELLGPEVPNDQNAAYLYEKAFDTLLDYEDDEPTRKTSQ